MAQSDSEQRSERCDSWVKDPDLSDTHPLFTLPRSTQDDHSDLKPWTNPNRISRQENEPHAPHLEAERGILTLGARVRYTQFQKWRELLFPSVRSLASAHEKAFGRGMTVKSPDEFRPSDVRDAWAAATIVKERAHLLAELHSIGALKQTEGDPNQMGDTKTASQRPTHRAESEQQEGFTDYQRSCLVLGILSATSASVVHSQEQALSITETNKEVDNETLTDAEKRVHEDFITLGIQLMLSREQPWMNLLQGRFDSLGKAHEKTSKYTSQTEGHSPRSAQLSKIHHDQWTKAAILGERLQLLHELISDDLLNLDVFSGARKSDNLSRETTPRRDGNAGGKATDRVCEEPFLHNCSAGAYHILDRYQELPQRMQEAPPSSGSQGACDGSHASAPRFSFRTSYPLKA